MAFATRLEAPRRGSLMDHSRQPDRLPVLPSRLGPVLPRAVTPREWLSPVAWRSLPIASSGRCRGAGKVGPPARINHPLRRAWDTRPGFDLETLESADLGAQMKVMKALAVPRGVVVLTIAAAIRDDTAAYPRGRCSRLRTTSS